MSQNQVFSPSGISTRGGDLETLPSSSAGLDQDDQQNQDRLELGSRPLTSNSRFQLMNIAQSYGEPSLLSSNGSFLSSILLDKFQNGSQLTSSSLNLKFSKLIKAEKKKLQKQNELIKEIQNWCNILTNDDCKKLLYNYIKILELEIETFDQLIKKREIINHQLLNVNKREKRTTELKLKRNKILVKLRENENKVGDSPITTLTKENLEELECSVEIVEDQFIRSINTGLKNSLAEYVVTTQTQSLKFKDASKNFLENYYINNSNANFNINTSSSNNNLHRLILQNKLNSSMMTRDISSSHTNNPKYVALSPNKIGKYLDNRFNNNSESTSPSALVSANQYNDDQQRSQHSQQASNRVNQSTVINITDQELEAKGIPQSHLQNIQQRGNGPPPTASIAAGQKVEDNKIEAFSNNNNNNDNDPAFYIINHYSTPGALGARPVSSNTHEWTS